MRSALTGLDLPGDAKIEKGIFRRAWRMSTLEQQAKNVGVATADEWELYRLQSGTVGADPTPLITSMRSAGWTVATLEGKPLVGTMARGGRTFLFRIEVEQQTAWLTIATVRSGTLGGTPITTTASSSNGASPTTPAAPPSPRTQPPAGQQPPSSAPPPAPPVQGSSDGYQYTVTKMRDGWVSTIGPDAVEGTNGVLRVLLFWPAPFDVGTAGSARDSYWQKYVRPLFDMTAIDERLETVRYSGWTYLEGEGRDRRNGQSVYVGMYIYTENGVATPVVVTAPDRAQFYAFVPRPDDFEPLIGGINRFMVAPSDLIGEWTEFSGAYNSYYYVATGASAGMAGASLSSRFGFASNGTYWSEHKGASGFAGSQSTFSQRYDGRFTVLSPTRISMTNRFNGQTDTFSALFRAVKGGRELVLVNEARSGDRYSLVRVKR
ncbi:MAG: hypothetical protein ACK54K_11380 [Gemmatimonadaceae bacterium]